MENISEKTRQPPDRVPLFGTWRAAYVAVIAAFAIEVAFFYALTRYFA